MKWIKFFYQFIAGVVCSNVSRAQYRKLVAILVGLVSGLVAICMKLLVHYVQHALTRAPVSKLPYLFFRLSVCCLPYSSSGVFFMRILRKALP